MFIRSLSQFGHSILPILDRNVPPIIQGKQQFSTCKQNVQEMRHKSLEAIWIKATGFVATHGNQIKSIDKHLTNLRQLETLASQGLLGMVGGPAHGPRIDVV